MNKVFISITAGVALLLGTVSAFAVDGFGVGLTASGVRLSTSGTETEGGETNSSTVSNGIFVGSIFAEYTKGWVTLVVDYVPFDADVSDATHTRTDTETSVTSTTTETSTSRTQTAAAEVSEHKTAYLEIGNSLYVKAGYVQVTVDTNESLDTGSKYGNIDLDGLLLGVGLKGEWGNNGFYKLEGTYTDYDDISLTSTVARTGVSTNNKITADLDVTQITLGLGV